MNSSPSENISKSPAVFRYSHFNPKLLSQRNEVQDASSDRTGNRHLHSASGYFTEQNKNKHKGKQGQKLKFRIPSSILKSSPLRYGWNEESITFQDPTWVKENSTSNPRGMENSTGKIRSGNNVSRNTDKQDRKVSSNKQNEDNEKLVLMKGTDGGDVEKSNYKLEINSASIFDNVNIKTEDINDELLGHVVVFGEELKDILRDIPWKEDYEEFRCNVTSKKATDSGSSVNVFDEEWLTQATSESSNITNNGKWVMNEGVKEILSFDNDKYVNFDDYPEYIEKLRLKPDTPMSKLPQKHTVGKFKDSDFRARDEKLTPSSLRTYLTRTGSGHSAYSSLDKSDHVNSPYSSRLEHTAQGDKENQSYFTRREEISKETLGDRINLQQKVPLPEPIGDCIHGYGWSEDWVYSKLWVLEPPIYFTGTPKKEPLAVVIHTYGSTCTHNDIRQGVFQSLGKNALGAIKTIKFIPRSAQTGVVWCSNRWVIWLTEEALVSSLVRRGILLPRGELAVCKRYDFVIMQDYFHFVRTLSKMNRVKSLRVNFKQQRNKYHL